MLIIAAGLTILPLLLVLDRSPAPDVSHIQQSGVLRVLTIEGPTTYYQTPDGPSGFEYDLLTAFTERLGVELHLEVAAGPASIIPRLVRGDAHFAAAALNMTENQRQILRFSDPYQSIGTQVVYRRGGLQPESFEDLVGRDITVPAGSTYARFLSVKKAEYPDLAWSESSGKTAEDLLIDVWEGNTEITLAPSNLIAIVRQHHPDLQIGFDLEANTRLAWAFPPDSGENLIHRANGFFEAMRENGELERLIDRYYGAATKFDYVNIQTFRRRVKAVLPRYEALFRMAAAEYGLDWRLLAALSYQESYWKPDAVSHTGVAGLMQITEATADFLEVKDRTDPRESVVGGARYLRSLHDRIHESVTEPDRTWFALAAYNVGLGHLLDARDIARRQGKDPDLWTNIKPALQLLSDPEWYTETKHGEARGYEAVAYVTRIRSFYDILSELRPQSRVLKEIDIAVPAL